MVAASALHEKQEHNLDQLRLENNELKQKIDGHYATSSESSRTDNSLGTGPRIPGYQTFPLKLIFAESQRSIRNIHDHHENSANASPRAARRAVAQ